MGTPRHGRKGRLLLDCTNTPGSGAPSIVPMLINWSADRSVDVVDTTSCDDDNKTSVSGLPNYKLTFDTNMDADSDLLYDAADGEARMHFLYPDRDAVTPKLRYNKGLIRLSVTESGGATAKLGQSFTAEAAGNITRAFI